MTGQCDRRSCPLANSRYATIKEDNGRAVLWMKTAERAHLPKRMWEKIVLPKNYAQALAVVDRELEFWPEWLRHKNKQRLTKIHQMLIRSRKLIKEGGPVLERYHKKDERREKKREAKALIAAHLERSIETELLERLKQGAYGDIYNYNAEAYERALKSANAQMDEATEDEIEREMEEEEEEDDDNEDEGPVRYLVGLDDEDAPNDEDDDFVGDVEDYWDQSSAAAASRDGDAGSAAGRDSVVSSSKVSAASRNGSSASAATSLRTGSLASTSAASASQQGLERASSSGVRASGKRSRSDGSVSGASANSSSSAGFSFGQVRSGAKSNSGSGSGSGLGSGSGSSS